jgi:hypothetical protein
VAVVHVLFEKGAPFVSILQHFLDEMSHDGDLAGHLHRSMNLLSCSAC